ncbi:MAG: helix-turn-helix transcriptional regulator [Gemmatimonadota bacterium]
MTVDLPRGEAMVGATPGPPERPAFGDDWLDIFRLDGLAEDLGLPLLLVDGRGKVVHESPAFCRLLEGMSGSSLLAAVRQIGSRAARGAGYGEPPPKGLGSSLIPGGGRWFDLRATRMPVGEVGRSDLALVLVRCRTPQLPEPRELQRRFGLTPREAEVALHLAQGASNGRVARRLDISPHTVRTHVEHIFEKLGIRSRKALALHLMEPRGSPR